MCAGNDKHLVDISLDAIFAWQLRDISTKPYQKSCWHVELHSNLSCYVLITMCCKIRY